VKIALSAAETGHLVLSTLHTINAGETINRILGMFEAEEQEQSHPPGGFAALGGQPAPDPEGWRRPLRAVRNHGAQPPHGGNHPPRRKRGQDLLRNHRGELHFGWRNFDHACIEAFTQGIITEEPRCSIAPAAASFPARWTTSRRSAAKSPRIWLVENEDSALRPGDAAPRSSSNNHARRL